MKLKDRETPTALLGVSVQTVRQRYGARWPQPVQRWLKDAPIAEVAHWLDANNGDEGVRTNSERGTRSNPG